MHNISCDLQIMLEEARCEKIREWLPNELRHRPLPFVRVVPALSTVHRFVGVFPLGEILYCPHWRCPTDPPLCGHAFLPSGAILDEPELKKLDELLIFTHIPIPLEPVTCHSLVYNSEHKNLTDFRQINALLFLQIMCMRRTLQKWKKLNKATMYTEGLEEHLASIVSNEENLGIGCKRKQKYITYWQNKSED